MRKIDWFKPKPKQKEEPSPWPYRLIIFFLLLFALNFALLIPPQIVSLFYEVEFGILQFIFTPVKLQVWFLISVATLTTIIGYAVFPVLYVPSIGKRGKHYIYIRTWYENDLRWFRLLSGYYLAVNAHLTRDYGKRVTVYTNVEQQVNGNIITLQTAALEVDISITAEKRLKHMMEYVRNLEHDIEGRVIIGKDDLMKLVKGGAKNEEER